MTPEQLQLIRDEIDDDPLGIGYQAMGADNAIATALNLIRPPQLPTHPQIRRGVVDAFEVLSRLNYTEIEALTAAQRQSLTIMMLSPQIDISADNIRSAMIGWFTVPASTPGSTRQMLGDFQDRDASRAEIVLDQAGVFVSAQDVGLAMQLP